MDETSESLPSIDCGEKLTCCNNGNGAADGTKCVEYWQGTCCELLEEN